MQGIQQNFKIVLSGTCYGYVRVSSNKQVEQGLSLDFQKQEIHRYAEYHRYKLEDIYEDAGKSAAENKLKKRKALSTVLDKLREGDIVVVYTLSRLSRCLKEFLEITKIIEDKKCALVLIRDQLDSANPYGNFTIKLIALLGELEVTLTRDRNAALLKFRRDNEMFIGKVPYGWRMKERKGPNLKHSTIEECEKEQSVIRYIQALYDDPVANWTYYKIARKLNEEGIPPPQKSKMWHDNHIKRILNRKSGPGVKYIEPEKVDGKKQKVPLRQPPKQKKRHIDPEKLLNYVVPILPEFNSVGDIIHRIDEFKLLLDRKEFEFVPESAEDEPRPKRIVFGVEM